MGLLEIEGTDKEGVERRLLVSREINIDTGCWKWLGYSDHHKYGRMSVGGRSARMTSVHRLSYMLYIGPIKQGMCILHRCDNPPCFNPKHLFIGTFKDNTQDMLLKGRGAVGELSPQSKLCEAEVIEIRLIAEKGVSYPVIADMFCIGKGAIGRIVRRETWKSI